MRAGDWESRHVMFMFCSFSKVPHEKGMIFSYIFYIIYIVRTKQINVARWFLTAFSWTIRIVCIVSKQYKTGSSREKVDYLRVKSLILLRVFLFYSVFSARVAHNYTPPDLCCCEVASESYKPPTYGRRNDDQTPPAEASGAGWLLGRGCDPGDVPDRVEQDRERCAQQEEWPHEGDESSAAAR